MEGRNLAAHVEEGERLESVHWYLLPLVEWFANNWNSLLHEERLPIGNAAASVREALQETSFPPRAVEAHGALADMWYRDWQSWWCRHAIHVASEGGLFPDVVFRRFRDAVEISWGDAPSAGTPAGYEFVESAGAARLSPQEVAAPLHQVLSEAVGHLTKANPGSERLAAVGRTLRLRCRVGQRGERLAGPAGLGTDR